MAGKRLIGDDNSINSFDGKTDQIHGQTAAFGVGPDPTISGQAIAPQIPFSRCVPGPLSLRVRTQSGGLIAGALYYGDGDGDGDDDTQIGTAPAYSVTKDNTGN